MLEIFLFVCIVGTANGAPNFLCKQHKMTNINACVHSVQNFKAATNDGSLRGNEPSVFLYCAPDGNWHKPKDGL